MSLRTRLVLKYAALSRPAVLKARSRPAFAEPMVSYFLPRLASTAVGPYAPELSRVVVSPSLVRRTAVSRDLTVPMARPGGLNRTEEACLSVPVTVDIPALPAPTHGVREIELSPTEPVVEERPGALWGDVPVSGNLLKPIGPARAEGRDYSAQEQIELFPPEEGQATERKHGDPRKAYTQRKVRGLTVTRKLGLWDLILPILKPPLNLDFPAQLDLPSELYPFQVVGVQRLVACESLLLADEMGTGKTVMASVALRILFHTGQVRRALVVCPASVVPVWNTHLQDWAGQAISCTIVRGPRDRRKMDWECPAHVYVTSYDTLRNDSVGTSAILTRTQRESFDLVILDEAHAIRNPSSGRSRGVASLRPTYRWALSGTPLQNRVDDLAAIFRFVKPALFPRDTPSPTAAKRLIEPFFLRRRKKDVLDELPDKVKQDLWLGLAPDQQSAYDAVLAGGREEFGSGKRKLTRMHVFALLTRLKQICNFAPGSSTSPKVDLLLEQLDEIMEDHKAVVFTQYLGEGLEKLRGHLERYGVVEFKGGMTDTNKARAIRQFQEDPDIRVFLGTVKTAGEGITLHRGNYVIHFDHWWNPAVAWQAEDRVHRKGQAKQVNVYSYWMEGTVEERIYRILERKGLLHEEIINAMSEKELDSAISMAEWCEVLGLEVHPEASTEEETEAKAAPIAFGEVYEGLSRLSPRGFEELVAEVFRHLGYPNVRVTGGAYDEGIDIIASRSTLGGREHVAVQCKRKAQVGVQAARELLGALASKPRFGKGFLVVSGALSAECRRLIEGHGNLSSIEGIELARRAVEFAITLPTG